MTDETLDPTPESLARGRATTGVLPSQALRRLLDEGDVAAAAPPTPAQIQPASLDLRLGYTAHRVRASFLPGPNARVADKLDRLTLYTLDLADPDGAVFEPGGVYIVPLMESLRLRGNLSGLCNPKSSTGRLDVFARVITDGGVQFDRVRERYEGPLHVEVSPRTFPIRVRAGTRLVQLRLKAGAPVVSEAFHRQLEAEYGLLTGHAAAPAPPAIGEGRAFTVDLLGTGAGSVVGWRAKPHAGLIDVDRINRYDPRRFWEPVHAAPEGIVLDPAAFTILASKEEVVVPPQTAAEMIAYDTLMGEFRVHYAGFFDPGFGYKAAGTRAVLEVRSHEVPFLVEDGQIVGRLVYERLTEPPETLYGDGLGSYQRQKLTLAKQFKPV